MSDSHVQVQPDSTGKLVDCSELTRPDGTEDPPVVYRQRVAIGSDTVEDDLVDVVRSQDQMKAIRVEDYALRRAAEDQAALLRQQIALAQRDRYSTGERLGSSLY